MYKHFAAIGLGIFWAGVIFITRKYWGGASKSISGHISTNSKTTSIFSLLNLASSILIILFFINWFFPNFQLILINRIVILTAFILFGVAGMVPDIKGVMHKIHEPIAKLASAFLLPSLALLLLNNRINVFSKLFVVTGLAGMIYAAYVFIKSNFLHPKFIFYQAIYFLCFDVTIIVVTYAK